MAATPFSTHSKRVRLTNAQIKALPTTPVEIVPAPDSGLVLVPIGVTYRAAFDSGAYTNVDDHARLLLTFDGDTEPRFGKQYFLPDAVRWSDGAVGFFNRHAAGRSALRRVSDDLAAFEATALTVSIENGSDGNLTGGHASNIMDVTVTYRVVERPPAVGVFSLGGGAWQVSDGQTTAWPDGYIVSRDGGRTFVIDDQASGGLTLSIVSSRPVVTYP